MSSADVWREQITQWVEKAEEDLTAAAHLMEIHGSAPIEPICFHAQQCVEKYIKVVLFSHGISFPRKHDITNLVALLPAAEHPSLSPEMQKRLTDYATGSRYPNVDVPISLAEARKAVASARRTRKEMQRLLPKAVLRRRKR